MAIPVLAWCGGTLARWREEWDSFLRPRLESPWTFPFDMAFGILAPVLVLYLDLTLTWAMGPIEMLPLRPYSSLTAFACIAAFACWYPFRARNGWWQAIATGPLLCGAVYAGTAGILLFPFALIGCIALIGVLGFVPLITGFVFGRSTRLAWSRARSALAPGPAVGLALLAAALFGGLCLGTGRGVRVLEVRATAVLAGTRNGDRAAAERTLTLLRAFPGIDLRELRAAALQREHDVRPLSPRIVWERITGRNLDDLKNDD